MVADGPSFRISGSGIFSTAFCCGGGVCSCGTGCCCLGFFVDGGGVSLGIGILLTSESVDDPVISARIIERIFLYLLNHLHLFPSMAFRVEVLHTDSKLHHNKHSSSDPFYSSKFP